MTFNPYEDKQEYDVETFFSQIEEYRDVHGSECEYVKCDHKNADYSVLDRQQKAYYLYWRDELSRGNCLKSDRGYVKLRLCEIINTDSDPQDGMRELRLLYNSTRMHGVPQSNILAAMFDYAVSRDLDLPIVWMGKGSVRSFMVTSEIMAFPTRRIGKDLVWYLSGGPKVHADGVDNMKHIVLFNDCLTAIDRFLMENTGKGIAQTYSDGMMTELYKIFLYLPYKGNRDYQITYEKLLTDGVFGEFMLGLFSYTRKVLCKEIGEKGPSTPSSFNKEFRKIVDRIAAEGPEEYEPAPRQWRGTIRTSMSSKERALLDMGVSLEAQYGTAENPKPILNIDKNAQKQHVSPHLKSDIERNWNVEVKGGQPYIPSGLTNPDYRSFSEQQRRFYVSWREDTRKGRYGETDMGYLWLYLCELINIKADAEVTMSQLVGLKEAYGYADEGNIIGKTCFDYSIVHKLPLPYPSLYESNITACLILDQFLKGESTHLDKEMLLFISETKDKTITREFDQDCVGITELFLRGVEERMKASGTTIAESCDLEKVNASITVFDGLKYFKEIKKARFSYTNYVYNSAFDDSLKEGMKAAFTAVRMKRTNKPVKITKFTAFGMDCKDLMTECVNRWYDQKEMAEIKEMASNFKLDRDAVSGAESALKEVTEMMAVDLDGPMEQKEETEGPEVRSDPWEGLGSSLDEIQKGYLAALLEGRGQEFIAERKLVRNRIEDSINSLAMDHVKDNILEDGEVFEEYRDMVRSISGLRGSN